MTKLNIPGKKAQKEKKIRVLILSPLGVLEELATCKGRTSRGELKGIIGPTTQTHHHKRMRVFLEWIRISLIPVQPFLLISKVGRVVLSVG